MTSSDTVVVVGAGIAGIACARRMDAAGLPVVVLERGGRAGGRMASRTLHGRAVDLGAQYVTASDPGFQAVVDDWAARDLARAWTDSFHTGDGRTLGPPKQGPTRWAAPEGMRALVEDLATGLDVRTGHAVSRRADRVRRPRHRRRPGACGRPRDAGPAGRPGAEPGGPGARRVPRPHLVARARAGRGLEHPQVGRRRRLRRRCGRQTAHLDRRRRQATRRRRRGAGRALDPGAGVRARRAARGRAAGAARRDSPGSSASRRRRSGRPYAAGGSRSRRRRATRRTGCSTRPAPSGSAATAGRRRRRSRPRGCPATPSGAALVERLT